MGVEPFETSVAGQRSAKRARVLLAARLHMPGGTVEARLRDLSRKGALVECSAVPERGAAIVFERGDTRIPATVAWIARGRIGLEFDHPIQESELLVHIGRAAQHPPSTPHTSIRRSFIGSMSPKDRRLAQAWSVAVGLNLPDKEG